MTRKEHLTTEGLIRIIAIRASMNNGLSPELKAAFPNIVPALRPLIESTSPPALPPPEQILKKKIRR